MSKLKLTILTLLILALGTVVSACVKKSIVNTNQNQNTNTVTTTEEIDKSDWKTYRNEEYGFEFKYPGEWSIDKYDKKILVYYDGWREGLPEGGSALDIRINNITIDQFIKDYNYSDPVSQIISKDDYLLNNMPAIMLIGSTAIGIDQNILFINKNNKSYIIYFHKFDKYHMTIISTISIF